MTTTSERVKLVESLILLLNKGHEEGLISQDDMVSIVKKLKEKI